MRLGAFELKQPLPELKEPHALVTLRPWVDVGSVGRLAFRNLERHMEARDLGELARPGVFFDFTRYRPTIHTVDGQRQVTVPTVNVRYARGFGEHDFVFLHLLEPHLNGEGFVSSIVKLLKLLDVRRYCLVGSMYDLVPHTKPIMVTGAASGEETLSRVRSLGVHSSSYEGPTSIASLVSQEANKLGVETMGLIAHLPQYAQMDVDHVGRLRILELLCELYDLDIDLNRVKLRARQQQEELAAAMEHNPEVRSLVQQLEVQYDDRVNRLRQGRSEEMTELSPEVQDFLEQLGDQLQN